MAQVPLEPEQSPPQAHRQADLSPLQSLLTRAARGDESALPVIRSLLVSPDAVEKMGGNLAARVEQALIQKASGNDVARREALLRKLELLREQLAGPAPSAIESLIVARITACWLHLHYLELQYSGKDRLMLELASFYERSIDRAQRRYLCALKALAQVRRLPLPVVQLNLATRQINTLESLSGAQHARAD